MKKLIVILILAITGNAHAQFKETSLKFFKDLKVGGTMTEYAHNPDPDGFVKTIEMYLQKSGVPAKIVNLKKSVKTDKDSIKFEEFSAKIVKCTEEEAEYFFYAAKAEHEDVDVIKAYEDATVKLEKSTKKVKKQISKDHPGVTPNDLGIYSVSSSTKGDNSKVYIAQFFSLKKT